jgi:hypothetical protein
VGGQTLTCAIRRSGIRGLDLFLATALASACWGSGGGRSGSVVSASGVGSLGVGSSRADGSGAGVAAASFGLCLTVLVDLLKQSQ